MDHDQEAGDLHNPWPRFSWWFIAATVVVSAVLGFGVLGRYQQNGPELDLWTAICRAVGINSESRAVGAPQPPLRTPTRIAWTASTLEQIASGNAKNGASVALNCVACHGEREGTSPLFPTLAGMDANVVYKQLDDFRSGKRQSGVMNAIATTLSPQDSADVAAYFAGRGDGLPSIAGEPFPAAGRSLRQADPAIRLVFAGDPGRGIPPCGACHGPGGHKLGAPTLNGQHATYIESQLTAFAQGSRQNDINEQMRVIAQQLTADEVHAVALFYSGRSASGPVQTNDPATTQAHRPAGI
jgi:cytochrome c553